MNKYIITEMYADGYERVAAIKRMDSDLEFTVHFLEYDEYLENHMKSQKRSVGDVLEGELSIDLVTVDKRAAGEIMHRQTISMSPHIEAIVQVCQVIDVWSVWVVSSLADDKIRVEFEHAVDYREGDIIYLEGSLEIEKAK